jgi:hypothetical protein
MHFAVFENYIVIKRNGVLLAILSDAEARCQAPHRQYF